MTTKDLLEFLKKNQFEFISGEDLATHFGVTRAGVWKHIKKLQDGGVKIEGVTNKGYRLAQSLLCEGEILAGISPQTIKNLPFENKNIICEVFDSIDSTNTYIKSNPKNGLHLVCSSEQTAGRGRRGNSFYSPANTGVYFSIAFSGLEYPNNIYTVAAAVAVCKVLCKISQKNTQIKWVNDIYLENRKVCGILTEGTFDFETGNLSEVIVGIGINLETTDFPEEIQDKASSLGISCNHNTLVSKIVEEFFNTLSLPQTQIIEIYSEKSMILGKQVSFTQNGESITALASSFNSEGNLVCKTAQGEITLKAGEISILPTHLTSKKI